MPGDSRRDYLNCCIWRFGRRFCEEIWWQLIQTGFCAVLPDHLGNYCNCFSRKFFLFIYSFFLSFLLSFFCFDFREELIVEWNLYYEGLFHLGKLFWLCGKSKMMVYRLFNYKFLFTIKPCETSFYYDIDLTLSTKILLTFQNLFINSWLKLALDVMTIFLAYFANR